MTASWRHPEATASPSAAGMSLASTGFFVFFNRSKCKTMAHGQKPYLSSTVLLWKSGYLAKAYTLPQA